MKTYEEIVKELALDQQALFAFIENQVFNLEGSEEAKHKAVVEIFGACMEYVLKRFSPDQYEDFTHRLNIEPKL